jgi:HlyD family secretion protein
MTDWSPRRYITAGLLVILLGLGGFVAWALTTEIDGAVVASGRVEVEARRQMIQHPDGGLVAAIRVREGEAVAAGQEILVLDGTELMAQRALLDRELLEVWAKLDRLGAETRGDATLTFRPNLAEKAAAAPEVAALLADETAVFATRRTTLDQTLRQLGERARQIEASIAGRERQLAALRTQRDLVKQDLEKVQALLAEGLAESARATALQREEARVDGEIGQLEAGIAEARSTIAGFEVEKLRLQSSWLETAQAELRTLQPQEVELLGRLRVIDTQIDRLVLRAPMAGTVLGLKATTVGGVIPAGGEIAGIVPEDTPLVLLVEIDPAQIDRVRPGQAAAVRFPNFNARITPEVPATIKTVSADTIADPATGRRFFLAELTLDPAASAALGAQALLPGMPVEAFIRTDARSPASFLLKPLADYFAYAMREE